MLSNLSRKRILYVITKSNFGGAQRYVFELASFMYKQGHEVAVACGGREELVSRLEANGIKTYQVNGFQRDIGIFKEIKALRSLSKIIKEFEPDVIHLNSAKASGLGSVVARLLRVPKIVFTVHGWSFLESERPLWWKVIAWTGSYLTALLAHKIILVSHHDRKKTNMPGIQKKCRVIYPSVADFSLIERIEARHHLMSEDIINKHVHDTWLVTIAELNPNKNHQTAIDAIAEFNSNHNTKIFYTIIGNGELEEKLKEQIDLRGMNEYIHLQSYLKEARKYLLAFDIFLLPSQKEGLPYTLLEAGQAGIPCLASNVGGVSEVIIENESGILTNPNNHMSIVTALEHLINNPEQRTFYSQQLKQHIKTNFTTETMMKSTEEIYTD